VHLPDFRLEVYLGEWEFKAKFHLTASDAETLTIGELLELSGEREAFEALGLGYAPTWGTSALRAAIAATYATVDPDRDVLAFAGAEEAMYWALQELVGPGDHAVVTVPNYQSMETLTLRTGAEVSGWELRPENGWAPDLAELEALLRPETTLVAVNFPNNPTGAVPSREAFVALAALCDERGIVLFSDEVYRGLELDPARTLPQACDLSPRAFSLNVMSKAYGLPGLRIGWLATHDRALLERLERRKHYTSICNAGPSEFLATIALRHGDRVRARNRAIIERNLPIFDAFFARRPEVFAFEHPQGGCVCFPRYLPGDAGRFCRDLVERTGVVLLPADIYASELGSVPADRFRIGVGRRDPEPALAALDTVL
jgi:aspartate/methionine/tyrosine aminotransferase